MGFDSNLHEVNRFQDLEAIPLTKIAASRGPFQAQSTARHIRSWAANCQRGTGSWADLQTPERSPSIRAIGAPETEWQKGNLAFGAAMG